MRDFPRPAGRGTGAAAVRSAYIPCAVRWPILLLAAALPPHPTAAQPPADPWRAPSAVIVGLSEQDLNRIALETFRAGGGPDFAGFRDRLGKGASDVRWTARLSEPAVSLSDGGRLDVRVDILAADLRVGHFERKLLRRQVRCDDLGVAVDPERPVGLAARLRVAVEAGALRLIPEAVELSDAESFRLIKPSRCHHAPLPRWLLWQLGKPRLRQRLEGLDDLMLERLRQTAAELEDHDHLSERRWTVPVPGAEPLSVALYARSVRSAGGTLLLTLDAASGPPDDPAPDFPEWAGAGGRGSFVALSEEFLGVALRSIYLDAQSGPRPPGAGVRRVLGSDAIRSLIPGLARARRASDLTVGLSLRRPPAIHLTSAPGDPALIRADLSGIEVGLWETSPGGPTRLGTLAFDTASVTLRPYRGPLPGVSFEIVENDWSCSARDIDADEEALAAVVEEVVFGQVFGTRQDPLGRDALRVGSAQLAPSRFEVRDRHLVIDLDLSGDAPGVSHAKR